MFHILISAMLFMTSFVLQAQVSESSDVADARVQRGVQQSLSQQDDELLRDDPSYGVIMNLCRTSPSAKDFLKQFIYYMTVTFHSSADILGLPLQPSGAIKLYADKGFTDPSYKVIKSQSFALALNDCMADKSSLQQNFRSFQIKSSIITSDYLGKSLAIAAVALFFAKGGPKKISARIKKLNEAHPVACKLTLATIGGAYAYIVAPDLYTLLQLGVSHKARAKAQDQTDKAINQPIDDAMSFVKLDLDDAVEKLNHDKKYLMTLKSGSSEFLKTENEIEQDQVAINLFQLSLNSHK